jgi:hypothetical protein
MQKRQNEFTNGDQVFAAHEVGIEARRNEHSDENPAHGRSSRAIYLSEAKQAAHIFQIAAAILISILFPWTFWRILLSAAGAVAGRLVDHVGLAVFSARPAIRHGTVQAKVPRRRPHLGQASKRNSPVETGPKSWEETPHEGAWDAY